MDRRRFVKTVAAAAVPGLALACRDAAGRGSGIPGLTQATGTALVSDPRYLDHVLIRPNGNRPPEIPDRLVRMLAELEARGLVEATVQLSPTVDPLLRIRAHHTGEHVDSVRQLGVTAEVAELAVSGALTAVDAVAEGTVRNAFCAVRPVIST